MMGRRHLTHRLARAVIALLAACPLLASAQAWNGNGPFLPSNGKAGTVHSLAIDAATGTVYAGTGSGTVFALNDATLSRPPIATDDVVTTPLATSIDIAVLANDTDPEGALDSSSIELQSNPSNGTASANANGTVTYTPNPGYVGLDSFRYTMRDQAGNESNEASVSVRVNAPPTAANDVASTLQNDPVTIDVLANDVDDDGTLDPSSVAVWNSPASGGAIAEADGRIIFTPAPDFSGMITFTYRVSDNDGAASNEATVTVTVTATNTPPVAENDSAGTDQDVSVVIAVLANDSDADGSLVPGSVTVLSAPSNGSAIANADGSITYTPTAGFSGSDSFSYIVEDDDGAASNAATVSVTIAAVEVPNVPPVAGNDSAGTNQGTPVIIPVLANDSDADGSLVPGSVTVLSVPDNGSAIAHADGSITYTPTAGFSGSDSFSYRVEDDDGAVSNAATVTVTVTAVEEPNVAPIAVDDNASTQQAVPVTIAVLANDSDTDGALALAAVTVQSAPANGSATVNADGTVTYSPTAGFVGSDSFTYSVADNDGAVSNEATVSVTVMAIEEPNIPPVAQNDTANTTQNVPVNIGVLDNDSDADGTLIPGTVTVQSAPSSGSTTVNGDGSIAYRPNADFVGTDTFTYTVMDNEGAITTAATVSVSVTAADDPTPTPTPTPPTPRRSGGGSSGLLLLAALAFMGAWRRTSARAKPARITTAG